MHVDFYFYVCTAALSVSKDCIIIYQALLLKTPEFKQFLGTNFHLIANNFSVFFRKQNSVIMNNTSKSIITIIVEAPFLTQITATDKRKFR